jgi:hypothetical protein
MRACARLEEADRLETHLARTRQDGARISVSASWSPRHLEGLARRQGQDWDLLVLNEKGVFVKECG